MEKEQMDAYQEVAAALENLQKKYGISDEDIMPVAKMCGKAIAQNQLDGIDAKYAQPMPDSGVTEAEYGFDDLAGALGGR